MGVGWETGSLPCRTAEQTEEGVGASESGGSLNLHPGLTVDPPESRRNGRGMPETCHVSGCQAGFKRCQEGHLGSSSGRRSSPDSVPGFLSFGSTLAFPWNISFSHSFVLIGW